MIDNENKEFSERLVTINRVAKVVKGGRRFGFAAIMIVGDNKGRVGYGTGKAKEVPEAVRKATEDAKTKMVRVHLKDNRTLHHDVVGRFGAGKVILRSASPGTGIIAGGPMRALFESLGIKDVVAKSTGTSNPHNMIKATFEAFNLMNSPRSVANKRSRKVAEIYGNQPKIEINKSHPYYRQAVKEAKGDESKIISLLSDKLEHQDPSANVNRENMKSLISHADMLMQFPSEADFIVDNLMNEIMYNTFQFEGISNPKINSDAQDKALTSTNPDAYGRLTLAALKPVANVMVSTDTFSPDGIQDLIANKIERAIQITAPDPIAKQVADRIKNKSVERGRTLKFSQDNKGITCLLYTSPSPRD